jgi:hypothetical protein
MHVAVLITDPQTPETGCEAHRVGADLARHDDEATGLAVDRLDLTEMPTCSDLDAEFGTRVARRRRSGPRPPAP